jgi:GH35 family endo-1,4-beta-xylanase
MKKLAALLLPVIFCFLNVQAQDTYHTNLQNTLQSTYNLPVGNWIFNNTEAANLNVDYAYGVGNQSTQAITGQAFSQKVSLTVNSAGSAQWNAGYGIKNINSIGNGHACLLVIWLRSAGSQGKVSLFVENTSNYDKEVYLTFNLNNEWTQYLVPFDAAQTYSTGGLAAGLHIAWQAQTVEVGGFTMLSYDTSVSVDDLPNKINNEYYGGWEPDAPWRTEAAQRIEQLRKANMTVRVEKADGTPIHNAAVHVEMLRHEFAFGSAVIASRFAGNSGQNTTYESKLLNLDGKGHGFNWIVFENDLKWPAWEQSWVSTKPEIAKAVQWLRNHDIKIRGHCLLWPGWNNLPVDIKTHQNDINYIRNRINNHIESIVNYPGIKGNIAEWDVLNEITTNRDLEMALKGKPGYLTGREIYHEVFQKLAEEDPDTKTYINDYVTIDQNNTGGGLYDSLKVFTQQIVDAGIHLDGLGFQGHIGGFPTSIYDVKSILDDFYNTFGTTAKITEYDINEQAGDELAAAYLRDFLTIIFSHPSMDGFMMWGFWDGAHWYKNAPLFYQNWTLKPSGQAFIDKVFNEWWTEENGLTDASGTLKIRGFKGKYKVTIEDGDTVLVDTIELLHDQLVLKKGNEIFTGTNISKAPGYNIFPNPASHLLTIQKPGQEIATVEIFDMAGRRVFHRKTADSTCLIPLDFGKGVFEVILDLKGKRLSETIVIQ